MHIKLWDLRKPTLPLYKYKVCDFIGPNLQQLYDNESIFDRFDLQWSPSGNYLSTGGYNDAFHVLDKMQNKHLTLKASAEQVRHRNDEVVRTYKVPAPTRPVLQKSRMLLSSNRDAPQAENTPLKEFVEGPIWPVNTEGEAVVEYGNKVMLSAWHPHIDCIATANLNCLYLYSK